MERPRTIAIHTPVWKRLVMTRAFYIGLKRSIAEFEELGYRVEVHIGGDEPEHEALAHDFGWHWHHCNNKNLGRKNEALLQAMYAHEWDMMLQMGSDDFLLPKAPYFYHHHWKSCDHAMFNSIYQFRADTGEGTLLKGYLCGAGRYVSRALLEATSAQGVVWRHAGIGNDGHSMRAIKAATGSDPVVMQGAHLADVKSEVNVTPFWRHDDDMYRLEDIVPEHKHIRYVPL